MAINNLKSTRDQNRNLTKIIGGLLGGMLLLSATVFGTSIAAAHLAKDTSIDSHGVLHDKHTDAVVQVSESIEWTPGKIIVDMNNRELGNLKKIALINAVLGVVEIEGTEGNSGRKLCTGAPKPDVSDPKRKLSIGTIHRKLCGSGSSDNTSTAGTAAATTSGTDVATTSGPAWPPPCWGGTC